MGRLLKADLYVDSIYDIDLSALRSKGICCLMFDIDNTMEEYATAKPSDRLCRWVENCFKEGFLIGILSNAKNRRANIFTAGFTSIGDYRINLKGSAGKPLKKGFKLLADEMGVSNDQVAMIGDQLFTDILGGNNFGAYTIRVSPINLDIEPFWVKLKRIFEKPFV